MKFAMLSLLLLSGCQVLQSVPSLRYCDKVSYVRDGRIIDIQAHCMEAVEPALPIPMPAVPPGTIP